MEVSPFNHLLAANLLPSDEEVRQILEFCSPITAEIDSLNAQISALEATLDSLAMRRDNLQVQLDRHAALLSPLRRLPAEILQCIFVLSLEPFACMDNTEPPIVLSQVCHRWRQVALSTPELWASLHIAFPCRQHIEVSAQQSFSQDGILANFSAVSRALQVWLDRSRTAPLRLSLYQSHAYGVSTSEEFGKLITVFKPHSRRWQHLEINLAEDHEIPLFSQLAGSDLPLLETFKIRVNAYRSEEDIEKAWLSRHAFLDNAPRLRRVHFEQYFPDNPALPVLPWKQLQELTLIMHSSIWSASTLLYVLKDSHNLRALSFRGYCDTEPFGSMDITLPSLEVLSISASSHTTCDFLNHILVPKLKELELSRSDPDEPSSIEACLKLIERSSCSLRKLSYAPDVTTDDYKHLCDALKLTPLLQDLHIMHTTLREPLLGMLTVDPLHADNTLCPVLQRIQFIIEDDTASDAVIHFLRSRIDPPQGVTPLQYANIISYSLDPEFNRRVERLEGPVSLQYSHTYYDPCWAGRPDQY